MFISSRLPVVPVRLNQENKMFPAFCTYIDIGSSYPQGPNRTMTDLLLT